MEAAVMDKLTVTIDGRTTAVPAGTTILAAARQMGISIPTLCNYRGMEPLGSCRVCLVELESPRGPRLVSSCSYPVENGMKVSTDSPYVRDTRKTILELLLAQAPESQKLASFAAELGVTATPYEKKTGSACILCGLCVKTCHDLMGRGAIGLFGRGAGREVMPAYNELPDRCHRPEAGRIPDGPAACHVVQPVSRCAAEHRLRASAGGAARSLYRPRQLRALQDRRMWALRHGVRRGRH
jgi:bidirectional [NiFe] hydrogenase diaphorase subunit